MSTIDILNPVGSPPNNIKPLAQPVDTVHDSSVGFRVQWPSFDIFMERVEELLFERHRVRQVHHMYTGSDGTAAGKVSIRGRSDVQSWNRYYDDLASKIQWGIFGLGA